ncbi:hypothetical protein QYR00_07275 [Agrobacterium tumefaciens]|nr:hypothetical protein QYR00_07275 [Agrobacterium tumefaciens]
MLKNKTTKLVPLERIDSEQVINIPADLEFDIDDLVIYQIGKTLVIEPSRHAGRQDNSVTNGPD